MPECIIYVLSIYSGFTLCFDNVNEKVKARHSTRDHSNKQYNQVHAFAAHDRVPCPYPYVEPLPTPETIAAIPFTAYLPTPEEDVALRSEMEVIVSRLLIDNIPGLQDLSQLICRHIPHFGQRFSAMKSDVVSTGTCI